MVTKALFPAIVFHLSKYCGLCRMYVYSVKGYLRKVDALESWHASCFIGKSFKGKKGAAGGGGCRSFHSQILILFWLILFYFTFDYNLSLPLWFIYLFLFFPENYGLSNPLAGPFSFVIRFFTVLTSCSISPLFSGHSSLSSLSFLDSSVTPGFSCGARLHLCNISRPLVPSESDSRFFGISLNKNGCQMVRHWSRNVPM